VTPSPESRTTPVVRPEEYLGEMSWVLIVREEGKGGGLGVGVGENLQG